MKIFILALAILFTISCRQTNPSLSIKNGLLLQHLHGPVKTLEENIYDANGNHGIGKQAGKNFYRYDNAGNLVEKNYYDDRTLELLDRYTYTTNDIGKPVTCKRYSHDGSLYATYSYKYDRANNLVEDVWYNDDGSVHTLNTYRYDDWNNCIEKLAYRPYYKEVTRTEYQYDNNGNRVEERFYDSNDSLSRKGYFKYNAKGNMVESTWAGSLYSTAYEYNEEGNEVASWQFKGDSIYYKSRNNYTKIDPAGNWLMKISFSDGRPTMYTERVITYY